MSINVDKSDIIFPEWHDAQGNVISCTEKIKVMQENMEEVYQVVQDAFEDALLIGCDEQQVRLFLSDLIDSLVNPY